MKSETPRYDLNVIVSLVLKYGVLTSAVLLVAGLSLFLAERPAGLPASISQLISTNYGRPTLDLGQIFSGAVHGQPIFVIQLGLVVLLATPIARVLASVLIFAVERDKIYVAITLVVLAILLLSLFVVGPAESSAG
ncbi:MAG: DUF1634 domain-containing protein [Thaumarchaeota archaeon]|nr:DUF1634 domain-containing protein [Nitrososphaerota archaeon]